MDFGEGLFPLPDNWTNLLTFNLRLTRFPSKLYRGSFTGREGDIYIISLMQKTNDGFSGNGWKRARCRLNRYRKFFNNRSDAVLICRKAGRKSENNALDRGQRRDSTTQEFPFRKGNGIHPSVNLEWNYIGRCWMATRGADVSILRSTARSIGCEGKRVKDSAADYVPDIWNLYFLSVDDHGKKIYLYCLYFFLCKYERSRSSRNERVLNFKLERYFRKDSRLSYWDRWKNRHQLLPTPIQYIRRPHTSRSNSTDARRSINHRPTLRLSLPSDRTSFVESTLTNPFEACSGDLNNAWKWQFTSLEFGEISKLSRLQVTSRLYKGDSVPLPP